MKTRTTVNIEKTQDPQSDFSEYIRGLGDPNIILKIFRYASYPNKPEWMEDLNFEMIKSQSMEQYLKEHEAGGPGSYLVRGIKNGKWIPDGSRVIHIAGERKAVAIAPASNGNGKHDSGDMFRVFEFQMKMQSDSAERSRQDLQAMMTANKQSSDQLMTLLLGLLASNKPPDLKAMVELMRDMNPATNQLAQLKEIVSVAKELTGGGDAAPTDPLSAAIAVIPALLAARNEPAAAAAPAAPVSVEVQPAASMPANTVPAGAGSTAAGGDERIRLVMMLKSKAARGQDPAFWAEYLEVNQDEAAIQVLVNAVRQHPWELVFATLQKIDPELAQPTFEQWFHVLYDELRGPAEDDDTKNNSTE